MTHKNQAVTVQPWVGRRDWAAYHQFCRRIYAADGAWVEPLHQTTQARWKSRHPWFEYGKAQAWLARRDGLVVGSISAQWDSRAIDDQGHPVGYFGQFECIEDSDVACALFETAKAWLRDQGILEMKGPFDLHINDTCGLLVEGFETPPMMMMPHHPNYYDDLLTKVGLSPEIKLYAYTIAPNFEAPRVMKRLAIRHSSRLEIRRLDSRRYAQEIELIRTLFNDAWQSNWGFVPFSEREFAAIGRELKPLLQGDYTAIAMLDGEAAGFLIALPNINELISGFNGRLWPMNVWKLIWRLKTQAYQTARVPLMGVRSDFHQGPLGALIAFSMIDAVRWPLHRNGVTQVEMSWILETNDGMNALIEAMGGERYKTYQMYQHRLDSPQ